MKMKRNKTDESNTADVLSLDGVTMGGEIPPATSNKKFKLASSIQLSLKQDAYVDDKTGKSINIDTNKNVEELMKKSVIQDGFEGKERAPKLFTSKHTAKLQAKKQNYSHQNTRQNFKQRKVLMKPLVKDGIIFPEQN